MAIKRGVPLYISLSMQTSLEVDAASLLAETLGRVTPFTVEFGAGQSSRNLEVTARVFDTLAPSDVNERVLFIVCCLYYRTMSSDNSITKHL